MWTREDIYKAATSNGKATMMAKTKTDSIPPHYISETCWVYGEAKGLAVVQEERDDNGQHIRTLQSVIPWDVIDKARPRNK